MVIGVYGCLFLLKRNWRQKAILLVRLPQKVSLYWPYSFVDVNLINRFAQSLSFSTIVTLSISNPPQLIYLSLSYSNFRMQNIHCANQANHGKNIRIQSNIEDSDYHRFHWYWHAVRHNRTGIFRQFVCFFIKLKAPWWSINPICVELSKKNAE